MQVNASKNSKHYEWLSRLYTIRTQLLEGIDGDIKRTCEYVYPSALANPKGLDLELLDELSTIGALATYASEKELHKFYELARSSGSSQHLQIIYQRTYNEAESLQVSTNAYAVHFVRLAALISLEEALVYNYQKGITVERITERFDEYVKGITKNKGVKDKFLPSIECKKAFRAGRNHARVLLMNLEKES